MRLKAVEMQGFKSFPDKTKITPNPETNAEIAFAVGEIIVVENILVEISCSCLSNVLNDLHALLMGGIASGNQCFGRVKAHFLIQHIGSACVFEVVCLCPMLISFTPGFRRFHIRPKLFYGLSGFPAIVV